MGPSVEAFRPSDPLPSSELATVVASLGGAISATDPYALVSIRELDARLVRAAPEVVPDRLRVGRPGGLRHVQRADLIRRGGSRPAE